MIKPTKAKYKTISPEHAANMLGNLHESQRRISGAHVRVLADRIKRGEWDSDAGIICVDKDGMLTDGQHRLAAIVRAEVTVDCVVIELPWSQYRDDTRRRGVADRNGAKKELVSVCNALGRMAGIQDGDQALGIFSKIVNKTKILNTTKLKPWYRAEFQAAVVLAYHTDGESALEAWESIRNCDPKNNKQRRVVSGAATGTLTGGNTKYDRVEIVYAACAAKAKKRDALKELACNIAGM